MKRTEWTKRYLTGALVGVMIMTSVPSDIYAASVDGVRTEEIMEEVIYEDTGSASNEAFSAETTTDESILTETGVEETILAETATDESSVAAFGVSGETPVSDLASYGFSVSDLVAYTGSVTDPVAEEYAVDNLTSTDSAIQSDYLDNDEMLDLYLSKQIREQQLESGIIDENAVNAPYDYMSPYDNGISPDPVPADDAAVKRADYLNLTGNERVLYDYLAEKIALVASGDITDTDFQIPVSLFNNGKTEYTKEELGVSEIIVDGEFNSKVTEFLTGLWDIDIDCVMDALLYDHPYELYWYDKKTDILCNSPRFTTNGTVVYYSGDYRFAMSVATDYSVEAAPETYKTDISKINAVNNTITNAMGVVNAAATTTDPSTGETVSTTDYSKLKYYRDWICNNVSYNEEAAAASDTIKVNNPWNLIYVFDNDPDTKVVCEGYSKAFKLLCDLTGFQSEYTGAYLVSGRMSDGKNDLGPHMWNIVRMDDGKYYLADITNYDNNPEGRGSLFLGKYYGYHTGNKQYDFEVDIQGKYLCFLYDYETRTLYSEEELTLSEEAYDKNTTPLPDPITYSVAFINGSKTIKTIIVPVDFVIPAEEIPQVTKEGYTLTGWYDPAGSGSTPSPFDFSAVITSDLNLYPIWEANPNTNPEDPTRKYVSEEGATVQMKTVSIDFPTTSVTYAGEEVTLKDYTLKVGDEYLKEGVNYKVTFRNNNKAGKATATFTGIGRFKGNVSKTFAIEKCEITSIAFAAGTEAKFPYGQGGVKPEVIVYSGDVVLPARDYSVKYTGNTQATQTAKVKVTGKSGAKGEKELTFEIEQAKPDDVMIEADDYAFTGKPKNTTKVVLYDKATGKKLKAGKDYNKDIIYTYDKETVVTDSKTKSETTRHAGDELTKKSTDVIPAGTKINVTTTLSGNYTGTVTGSFYVVEGLMSKATIKVPTAYWSDDYKDTGFTFDPDKIVVVLNGKIVQPSRKVLKTGDNGEDPPLVDEPNYEIVPGSYTGNMKPGKASMKVHGLGNLGGVKTVNFTIIDPNKVTYSYVTFNPNGATSGTMSDKKIVAGKTAALTANKYKKSGSTFAGWNTAANGSGHAYADKDTFTASNQSETVTLYAQWIADTYTVTYVGADGIENDNPATYTYNDVEETELRLNAPVWDDDHVFLGWYSDAAFKKRVTGIEKGSTGNLTFYAKWQKNRSAVIRKIANPEGDYIDATNYADRFKADKHASEYKEAVEDRSSDSLKGFKDAVPGDGQDDYAAIRTAIIVAGRKYQFDNAGITDDSQKQRVTVYLPAGSYNYTPAEDRSWGIELEEGVDLVMDNNAIINVDQVNGDYPYYVMSIADEHDGQIANASIRGGQIIGERYLHKGNAGKYDGHGVAIIGATNVSVSDMMISSNWGDGIYLGTKMEDIWDPDKKLHGEWVSLGKVYYGCHKVTISNCNITDNRRNNISVVDAHDLIIESCDISDAHGSAPQCGILIEPNFESGRPVEEARCKNVTIRDTYISALEGKDSDKYMCLYTNYHPDKANYIVVDGLRVENCVFNGYYGIYSGLNYSESGNEYNGTKHIESRVTKGTF